MVQVIRNGEDRRRTTLRESPIHRLINYDYDSLLRSVLELLNDNGVTYISELVLYTRSQLEAVIGDDNQLEMLISVMSEHNLHLRPEES